MRRVPALRDLIARGPVLSARKSALWRAGAAASGAFYTGNARTAGPVLPVQVFGAAYDLDLVLVSDHPDWDMHELARLQTPTGPVWLCKDSRAGSLVQSLVAEVDDLAHLLPEVPLARFERRVQVDDHSDEVHVDVRLAYDNADGEAVEIAWAGPAPRGTLWQRNSSTMGHSASDVLAVLDVRARSFAHRARVTIAGRSRAIERVWHLVPLSVALVQTQAGFSRGSWRQTCEEGRLVTTHASGAIQTWEVEPTRGGCTLRQTHPWRTLLYHFAEVNGRFELMRAEVQAFGAQTSVCQVYFSPWLPDTRFLLERPFEGGYLICVNDLPAHAVGRVQVHTSEGRTQVELHPQSPRWTCDRPLSYTLCFDEGGVQAVGTMRGAHQA